MSFYVSTATFFLLHCDEWDHVVALRRHKFVTGATLLQLDNRNTRSTCPMSVFTGIGQTLMSRPEVFRIGMIFVFLSSEL